MSEMSDEELVDRFGNTALRAGRSNSGLCIDPCASSHWELMQELRGEVKKRFQELREEIERLKESK